MHVVFDCLTLPVNPTFGTGLLPPAPPAPQIDNTLDVHEADAASIAEQTAYSIARTIAEETATYFGHLVEADRAAELDRLAGDGAWYSPVLSAF